MSRADGGTVARAVIVSAVLGGLGSACGLGRDLLVGALFGASRQTDAFFVAWTVPETVAPLLIEGTMAFVMVPAFGRALAAAEPGGDGDGAAGPTTDPTRQLIEATYARITVLLTAVAAFIAVCAPWLVDVFAPGLPDPDLAATCMRAVAATVPLFGLAGYLAAALRTHGQFAAPGAIYLAYNLGIIVTIALTFRSSGVVGAAIGISVGAALMVAVQLPSTLRHLPVPRNFSLRRTSSLLAFGAFLPVAAHTVARQAQTFVERFAASGLVPGTISHLNYAQKIAQVPLTLTFMAAAVTFPIFAKKVASGSLEDARRRMETDLALLGGIALLVTAYLALFAPEVVAVLFQRGEFDATDTLATAAVLRVYVLGLLGQTIVSLLVRPFYAFQRVGWFPAIAMGWGLLVTVGATAAFVGPFGAAGIAGANALGITVTAVILAAGARQRLATAPTAAAYGRLALLLVPLGVAVALAVAVRDLTRGMPAIVVAGAGGVVMVGCLGGLVFLFGRGRRALVGTRRESAR